MRGAELEMTTDRMMDWKRCWASLRESCGRQRHDIINFSIFGEVNKRSTEIMKHCMMCPQVSPHLLHSGHRRTTDCIDKEQASEGGHIHRELVAPSKRRRPVSRRYYTNHDKKLHDTLHHISIVFSLHQPPRCRRPSRDRIRIR